jgi:hypothetical protein
MMIYYKEIDILYYDTIIQKSLDFVKNNIAYHRPITETSFYYLNTENYLNSVPEINLAFSEYNLECRFASIYIMYNPTHTFVHVDRSPTKARINLPLLNCDNTFTHFYSGGELQDYINPGTGMISSIPKNDDDITLESSLEMKKTTVVRITELHKVELPSNNPVPRITLSLFFDKDPVFLLDS